MRIPSYYKLKAALWKCLIIRKRHWVLTLFSLFTPILLFLLISWARSKIGNISKHYISNPIYNEIYEEHSLYQQFKIDISSSVLLYSPRTHLTDKLITEVQILFGLPYENLHGFANEDDLIEYTKNNSAHATYAVVFNDLDNGLKGLDYKIRHYEKYVNWQSKLYNHASSMYIPGKGSEKYFHTGLISLQMAIDKAYLNWKGNNTSPPISLSLQEFPYPPHTEDVGFQEMFMIMLPLITFLSSILLFPAVLKRMMEEKETGVKELMKMMGLPPSTLYLAWYLDALWPNLISAVIAVICMKSDWNVGFAPIEHTNPFTFGLFLLLYWGSCISFCFLMCTILKKPTMSTTVSTLIWTLTYSIPNSWGGIDDLYRPLKYILCLIPNVAMDMGYRMISVYELRGVGLQWSNYNEAANGESNDITFQYIYLILLFDILFYLLLAVYLDQIRPGVNGVGKHWSYPIKDIQRILASLGHNANRVENNECTAGDNVVIESCELIPGVEVTNLFKKFDSKIAVNNLNIKFHKGEISVLLGKNGAGKTTTMSILSGMLSADGGRIEIHGREIQNNLDYLRNILGICPQQNLHFPDLTVYEHLMFFAMVHNMESPAQRVDRMLEKLNLQGHRNSFPDQISGGMKRKLSIGMALIADPMLLIMDEPSSGLDPEARREIWDVILNWRKEDLQNRTVLISTHFLEEADVLGDRIAILDHGNLIVYGTPMFLKSHYSVGSTILVSLKNPEECAKLEEKIHEFRDVVTTESGDVLKVCTDFKVDTELVNFLENDPLVEKVALSSNTIEDVFMKTIKRSTPSTDAVDGISTSSLERKTMGVVGKLFKRVPWLGKPYNRATNRFGDNIRKNFSISIMLSLFMTALTVMMGSVETDVGSQNFEIQLDLKMYGKTLVYYRQPNNADKTLEDIVRNFKMLVESSGSEIQRVSSVSEALIEMGQQNIEHYNRHAVMAVEFNSTDDGRVKINMMHSNHALHGAPIVLNAVMSALSKALYRDNGIRVTNAPLIKKSDNKLTGEEFENQLHIILIWTVLFPIALLFLVSSFIKYPQEERKSKFKYLIYMTGEKFFYWAEMFLFHNAVYLFSIVLMVAVAACLSLHFSGLTTSDIGALFVVLVFYGIAIVPFVFFFSFYNTHAMAIGRLSLFTFLFGLIAPLVMFVVETIDDETYKDTVFGINCLLHLFPQYWLTRVLVQFTQKWLWKNQWEHYSIMQKRIACQINPNPCCENVTGGVNNYACSVYKSHFTSELSFLTLWAMFGVGCLYLTILYGMEYRIFQNIWKFLKRKFNNNTYYIRNVAGTRKFNVDSLEKRFGKAKIAVKNLTFSVEKGKCFGLLGVNGAGKTTSFKMLTVQEEPTKGNASIKDENSGIGWNMLVNTKEYLKVIGYCPQFDATNGNLSARQTLFFFAKLRGLGDESDAVVDQLIRQLGLAEYADIPCANLSGGNKRKVSLGIAVIGNMQLILLDEPTSGVDPLSRRQIWSIIQKKKEEVPVVLTSHSMDECEVLCDDLAIMKEGEIIKNGTVSDLKLKCGEGINVQIKLNSRKGTDEVDGRGNTSNFTSISTDEMKLKIETVLSNFKPTLRDEHITMLHYFIDKKYVEKLTPIFKLLEKLKKENENVIEDYSVSTATLEDIFLSVARGEENARE